MRGGTNSVGLAVAAIAKNQGLAILAITRRADREKLGRSSGADHVLANGSIVQNVKDICRGELAKCLSLLPRR
jgi:NADPH:quinone reductase-like Zn-dependent oxidoreductase